MSGEAKEVGSIFASENPHRSPDATVLASCPCCGSTPRVTRRSGVKGLAVKCKWLRETVACKCGLSITGKRPGEGKRLWNRRVSPTPASSVGTNGEAGSAQKPVVTELVEFGKHRNWELSYSYAEDDECWCVHQVNGGINDREWTCIGKGVTPSEAVSSALSRQAQTGNGEGGA